MAIWTVPRLHHLIRIPKNAETSAEAWRFLFGAKSDHNCDGEIMALRTDEGIAERLTPLLISYGFRQHLGPDCGNSADFVTLEGFHADEEESMPDWLSIVPVNFFLDEATEGEKSGFAWKLKESDVFDLINHPNLINHHTRRATFTKGYTCDWPPHIGKIQKGSGGTYD